MRGTNNSDRKHGFTLIELLVVIAIIAILAAILFPVFAQARAKARQTACISNLKQNALAILSYDNDYDETYPLFDYFAKDSTTGNWCNYMYYQAIMPYQKSAGTLSCPQTPYAQNFPDGWANASAVLTSGPSASGITLPTTVCTVSPTITWVGYTVNDTIINFGPQVGNNYPWPYPGATGFVTNRTMASIPFPDEQIVQYDGYISLAGGDANTTAPYADQNQDGQCDAGNMMLLASHTGNMDASFADGHVKTVHCAPDTTNNGSGAQDYCIGADGLTAFPMSYVTDANAWQGWPTIYGLVIQNANGTWGKTNNQ